MNEKNDRYRGWIEKYKDHLWVFTGCGTSYYAALIASHMFSFLTSIRSIAIPASDILFFPKSIFHGKKKSLVIPLSRSGKTTEIVLAAAKARREYQLPTLAVSCDCHSILCQQSELSLNFSFEPEISVVMTSSFTTMLLCIYSLALHYTQNPDRMGILMSIAKKSAEIMKEYESRIIGITEIADLNDFVFLGQGPFYGLAKEAALKMQEMSIATSNAYHALEYRHGPKSTATHQSLITLLGSEAGGVHEIQLMHELAELGARTFILHSDQDIGAPSFDISVASGEDDIRNIFYYAPLLQLMGFYRAIFKGINPDHPRHLSQIVTLHE